MNARPRQRRLKRFRQGAERILVMVVARVIPRLSRRGVVRLSHLMARAGYAAAGRDRRTAEANLMVVFGDTLSTSERKRIIIASFQSFALMMLDTFWLGRDTRRRIESVFVHDELTRRIIAMRRLICITGHFGNWDVFGAALAAAGMPLSSVAMPQQNTTINQMLNAQREATGMRVIPRDGALRHLLRELRQDRCVALLMDQNTRPEEGGVFLPFFGLPVPVSPVVDVLHKRTGATLGLAWCLPDATGIYHVHDLHVVPPELPSDDPHAVTRAILRELEEAIRRYPEYWLWAYRRWRFIPAGSDARKYPFYAIPYTPKQKVNT